MGLTLRGRNLKPVGGKSSWQIKPLPPANVGANGWTVSNTYAEMSQSSNMTDWTLMADEDELDSVDTLSYRASMSANGDVIIICGSAGHVDRTDDNGATWNALPTGLNTGSTALISDIDNDGKGTWIVLYSDNYAARSTDNGVTWSALPFKLSSDSSGNLQRMAHNGSGTWMAVFTDGAVVVSTNNGEIWSRGTPIGETALSIATDSKGNWAVGLISRIITSSDLGQTWSFMGDGIEGSIQCTEIETDGNGTWVTSGTSGYAFVTHDNGANWTELPRGLNSGNTRNTDALATDKRGNWMVGYNSGFGAYSTDNGDTWIQVTNNFGLPRVRHIGDIIPPA